MANQSLFKFKEYVQLCQADRNVENINLPMIQYNIKIYKGVTNTIDFIVRNNDRVPVNLVGYQIEALIQRVENPELLLQKVVKATDETAGKAQLWLSNSEIEDWEPGYYRYAIKLTDVTKRTEFLYTDINRSTFSTFELIAGLSVSLDPAIEIDNSQFVPYPKGFYENTWSTGALEGDAQTEQANGMHTIVAYTNKFHGKFWIQASLTLNAPGEDDWFDIPLTDTHHYFQYDYTNRHHPDVRFGYHHHHHHDHIFGDPPNPICDDDFDYNSSPRVKVYNFTGNYYWVRAFYQIDRLNIGSFDKILYKN